MVSLYSSSQIEGFLTQLNKRFGCGLSIEEFQHKSFSASSLQDLLVQRISEELSDEWTTEKAYSVLSKGLLNMGIRESELSAEVALERLFPKRGRREQVAKWSHATGLELDVLKPNSILYGLLVFIFFACIPLGFGMDWFFSGMGMLLSAAGIYLLGKTASNFKMHTLGQMAEAIAWRLYLKQQKSGGQVSRQTITEEVQRVLSKG